MSEDREETDIERLFKKRLELIRDDTVRETALEMLEDGEKRLSNLWRC